MPTDYGRVYRVTTNKAMSKRQCAEPTGVQLSITESGHVVIQLEGCDAPPIKLNGQGAEHIGSSIQSAGTRAMEGWEFDDE